jgi:hypothetical protein
MACVNFLPMQSAEFKGQTTYFLQAALTTPKEMHDQRDHGDNQQYVN